MKGLDIGKMMTKKYRIAETFYPRYTVFLYATMRYFYITTIRDAQAEAGMPYSVIVFSAAV